jgi:hypothetical protein
MGRRDGRDLLSLLWLELGRLLLGVARGVGPTPFFAEFFDNETNTPACFLSNFVEDSDHFFLFAAGGEAFGSDG